MPVVKNEQDEKRQSQFLKYVVGEDGNLMLLLSHLYRIDFHFLPKPTNRSVSCKGDKCSYCEKGYDKRAEYNYRVNLNGEEGYIDIKPSVFFAIQGISKAQKRDPRSISWTVIKTGADLATKYVTSKDDNLAKEDFEKINKELNNNTEKLTVVMLKHEADLDKNYSDYEANTKKVEVKKVATEEDPPVGDDPEA